MDKLNCETIKTLEVFMKHIPFLRNINKHFFLNF